MPEENNVESLIVHQFRALAAKIDERFDKMEARFDKMDARFDKLEAHIAATDEENARVLARILENTANINTVLIEVQARGLRHEERIAALEEGQPTV